MTRPPVALTIAGSDPSGGAGIQADLKTFSALGVYGTSVITALTAQSTQGVTGVHVVPPDFVTQQLQTLVADVRLDAIKIGMLANADIIGAVGDFLLHQDHVDHVVLDPVMVATSGDRLLDDDAVQAMRELMPLASLITPNLAEAAALLDTRPASNMTDMRRQATTPCPPRPAPEPPPPSARRGLARRGRRVKPLASRGGAAIHLPLRGGTRR